jgi:hypothetical protein
VHVVVEGRAEAVEKGDAAERRAGRSGWLGIRGPAWRREQEPLSLFSRGSWVFRSPIAQW